MDENPTKRRRRWRRITLLLAVSLALYAASFGPAYWWQHSSGNQIIPLVYAPLVEAAWHVPLGARALAWYAACGVSDNGKRLGCAPLSRDGIRAFSWITPRDVFGRPLSPMPPGR
jgi:hypothetical protein